ncbi:MAG: branched-chain amino acid ABC transporter permease [Chloroflexi bacterium]|nr:branched-chain amino acid ABC transporter permease [Chloroflexota bacterium]
MELFLQFTLNGLVVGSLYAIYGLSFGLIYWTTRIFHFAHGAAFASAGYALYVAVVRLELPLLVALGVAAAVAAAMGMACEVLIYRPLRRHKSPPLVAMIASLGVFIIVQNSFVLVFSAEPRPLTQTFFQPLPLGPVTTTWLKIGTLVAGIAALAVVVLFLFRTRLGTAIRAVVDNPSMAVVIGIDLDRVHLLTYAIGSVLVVPASFIVTLDRGASPDMGMPALLSGAIAVFVGGVGAIPAAAVAGWMLGLAENLGALHLGSEWLSSISFLLLIVFLLVRPSGVFGGRLRKVEV